MAALAVAGLDRTARYPAPGVPMTDPIIAAARFITDHLEWLRHHPRVDEALADIAAAARVVAGIAMGPRESQYLGPCGAPVLAQTEPECGNLDVHSPHRGPDGRWSCYGVEEHACDGDVYAPRGGSVGRCRDCKAEVASEDRRLWLDALVRSHAFTDTDIADALRIPVKTIRSWATERAEVRNGGGKLVRSASPAKLRAHTHDRDGRALYLLGDVADLAAADAARREERRTHRQETAA